MGRKNLPNLYSHSTVKSPCKDCPNRDASCHGQTDGNWNCAAWGLYKADIAEDSAKRRQAQLTSVRSYNRDRVQGIETRNRSAQRGRRVKVNKQY